MIKFLSALLVSFGLLTSFATAEEADRNWDIIGYGGPGGLFNVTAQILQPSLGGDIKMFKTCVESANYARKTNKPSLVLMDLDEHTRFLLKGDDQCTFFKEGDLPFVNIVGEGFLNIYAVKDSGNDMNRFTNDEVFVGVYEGLIMFQGAKTLFEAINPKIKAVPYQNGGAIIAALEAGEIQYGWTSRPKAKYEVIMTTDPEGRGDAAIAKDYTNSGLNQSAYIFYVAAANIDPAEASKVIQQILESDEAYAKMFRSAGYSITNGLKSRLEQEDVLKELSKAYLVD